MATLHSLFLASSSNSHAHNHPQYSARANVHHHPHQTQTHIHHHYANLHNSNHSASSSASASVNDPNYQNRNMLPESGLSSSAGNAPPSNKKFSEKIYYSIYKDKNIIQDLNTIQYTGKKFANCKLQNLVFYFFSVCG
jgi:hypothetical protein